MNCIRVIMILLLMQLPVMVAGQLRDDERAIAETGKVTSLEQLHHLLVTDRADKAAQVRAFYIWISHHISYDVPASKVASPDPVKQEPAAVLRSGKAICHGYSRLFQELCLMSEVPCALVNGYALPESASKLYGHTWNAVFLNNKWQLVDVTWGAGGVDATGKYLKDFTDRYYLPLPEEFLKTHYPFDPAWQLSESPASLGAWSDKRNRTEAVEGEYYFNYNDTLMPYLSAHDTLTVKLASTSRMVAMNPNDRYSKQEHAIALLSKANFFQRKGNDTILLSNKKPGATMSVQQRKELLTSARNYYEEAIEYYRTIQNYDASLKQIVNQAIASARNNIAYIGQELKR